MTDPQHWDWYWKLICMAPILAPWVTYVVLLFIVDAEMNRRYGGSE